MLSFSLPFLSDFGLGHQFKNFDIWVGFALVLFIFCKGDWRLVTDYCCVPARISLIVASCCSIRTGTWNMFWWWDCSTDNRENQIDYVLHSGLQCYLWYIILWIPLPTFPLSDHISIQNQHDLHRWFLKICFASYYFIANQFCSCAVDAPLGRNSR